MLRFAFVFLLLETFLLYIQGLVLYILKLILVNQHKLKQATYGEEPSIAKRYARMRTLPEGPIVI